jgi:formate-dependent nitrite reductase membrane component NrfD
MTLRQWMVPHEWMVKYTPQTEWIERRGMLVWIAEVFTSIGAGLYLVSLFYNSLPGMYLGWFIIAFLKMLPHLIYLGKPLRFWRALPPFTRAWRTSWVARGMFFTVLFLGIALVQFILAQFLPATGWEITFKVLGGITAFLAGIYSGFVFNYCRSVPFWNSALLPLVFIIASIADGFALIMALGLGGAQVDIHSAEAGSRILLIVNAVIIATYLWRAAYASKTARYSALLLLRGRLTVPFWVGVVAFGIVIPLAVSVSGYFNGEASIQLLIVAVVLHMIGAFSLKYCLLKAGIHNPTLPLTA